MGATLSDDDGWPTRSGIFGRVAGALVSFGASTTCGCDLNRPVTLLTSDLPQRMPAPTRISTTPTAIALLNGNALAVRGRFGSRSPAEPMRERGGGGIGACCV